MMKSYRTTLVLIGLFFASLLGLLGLEYTGVYTVKERALRETRVLPALISIPEASIDRVAIDRGSERLVFERRGRASGLWQMVEPTDVAAEPTRLETLVRNLKELRRSPDSGAYSGPTQSFGLEPPTATVRLWASSGENPSIPTTPPIATLAVGNASRAGRYVRPEGTGAIEIVDAGLLSALDLSVNDWREPVVMSLPTFQATSIKITQAGKVIRVERGPRGQWRLTAPVTAPANGAKVESLLAALSSLRVVDGPKGFIADNVSDFAPYGLLSPSVKVEVTSNRINAAPLVLHVGKAIPDRTDRVYVRQGQQDDVVIVDARALSEIPVSASALRSQHVTEFEPALANRIQVEMRTMSIALHKEGSGWELLKPKSEKADQTSVETFLKGLRSVQTSEFLEPQHVNKPELDPPLMSIKIWEATARTPSPASTEDHPALSIQLGRHDLLRKTVYARIEHDSVILALPDTFLDVLPKQPFPFRVLSIGTERPEQVKKLTITCAGRIDEVEPDANGEPNRWRMKRPVDAAADTQAVTEVLTSLASLRANAFVAESISDGKAFGLDQPVLEVVWQTEQTRRLRIGSPVPRTSTFYAALDDRPFVFTLGTDVIDRFQAEFHDHRVMSFPANRASRLVLRWSNRTVAIRRRMVPGPGQPEWVDEPNSDVRGIDLSRMGPLVNEMSKLQTLRFIQYDGPISVLTGLLRPRLVVEVELGPPEQPRVLRIGHTLNNGLVLVAQGTADSGPVFLLPSRAWDALIQSGERFDPLPADVFAPADRTTPPRGN